MIEDALRAVLLADPAVAAGAVGGVRTPPLPQITNPTAQLPQVTIQRVAGSRTITQDGPGLAGARFQVDAWAKDYREARELAGQVAAALNGFPGSGQVGNAGAEALQLVAFVDGSDSSDYDESVKLHRATADYRVELAAESTAA